VGQLAHREAMFGNHWLCIYDVNRTILRLNISKLKLFRKKNSPRGSYSSRWVGLRLFMNFTEVQVRFLRSIRGYRRS
jgi:hypothetical protein